MPIELKPVDILPDYTLVTDPFGRVYHEQIKGPYHLEVWREQNYFLVYVWRGLNAVTNRHRLPRRFIRVLDALPSPWFLFEPNHA